MGGKKENKIKKQKEKNEENKKINKSRTTI